VAPDERLTEVVDFLRDFLAADTALARAALGEPDDDTYLAIEARARARYATDVPVPLGPLESRWAVPGGSSPHATIDVSDSVGVAPLYAVTEIADAEGGWIGYAGGKRDPQGTLLAQALEVTRDGGRLLVRGMAARNRLPDGAAWEATGGVPVRLGAPVAGGVILQLPQRAEDAEFLTALLP
jgi:hypothetical protein